VYIVEKFSYIPVKAVELTHSISTQNYLNQYSRVQTFFPTQCHTLNKKKIKPVALAIVKLRLSEGISQSVSQSDGQ